MGAIRSVLIRGLSRWAILGLLTLTLYFIIAWFFGMPLAGSGMSFLIIAYAFSIGLHAIAGFNLGVTILVFGNNPLFIAFWGGVFGIACGLASARRVVAPDIPWNNAFFLIVAVIGLLLGIMVGIGVLGSHFNR